MLQPQRLADIDRDRFISRAQSVDEMVIERTNAIMDDVRDNGDAALRRWTKELDNVHVDAPFLPKEQWRALADQCPADVQGGIDGNLQRIRAFHERQVGGEDTFEVAPGVTLGRRPVPFQVAGCYVPGGRASYPSSVLMTVVPAVVAGVERILVVTPPSEDGTIDPAVAYAAQAAGATDILLAGGAQAIAALTYGTDVVPAADCIVGPGNAYVTAAKQRAAQNVVIDSPAGPSELLVLADETANPAWVAADMVAQAEHDPDAQSILITTSTELAGEVSKALEQQATAAPRSDIIQASLRDHGAILVANDLDEAVDFANDYAAEHLEIITDNPSDVAVRIRNAGSIFLGAHAPVPLGDYGSGTNHVLPTMGAARTRSGLNLDHFRKWITWQDVTAEGLASIADDITVLADAEGLNGHADAVRKRLEAPE